MIDLIFFTLFLICMACGKDGLMIGSLACLSLLLVNLFDFHPVYYNAAVSIAIFSLIKSITSYKVKCLLFILGFLNFYAACDYFVSYITLFYISFPYATMLINSLLIMEILKNGSRSESIIADIDSFIFHAKSHFEHFKIKARI